VKRALVALVVFTVACCASCSSKATGSSSGTSGSGGSSGGTSGSGGPPPGGTTTDQPGPPPPPGSPTDCGNLFAFPGNNNCQKKLDAVCCAAEKTCSNDFECESIVSCSHTCNHVASCIDDCVNSHASGGNDFNDVVACADTNNVTTDCAWP
jgi:hypothetical protein